MVNTIINEIVLIFFFILEYYSSKQEYLSVASMSFLTTLLLGSIALSEL